MPARTCRCRSARRRCSVCCMSLWTKGMQDGDVRGRWEGFEGNSSPDQSKGLMELEARLEALGLVTCGGPCLAGRSSTKPGVLFPTLFRTRLANERGQSSSRIIGRQDMLTANHVPSAFVVLPRPRPRPCLFPQQRSTAPRVFSSANHSRPSWYIALISSRCVATPLALHAASSHYHSQSVAAP